MTNVTLRRSQLAVPASSQDMIAKAAESNADEVFLDLEDSVAPNEKEESREPLISALHDYDWDDKVVSFRINGLDTQWWYEDLITVVSEGGWCLDDIIVPMVANENDIAAVDRLLTQVEVNAGLEVGQIGLEPQIENGSGMNNVKEIGKASDRIDTIIFGPGDYTAAIGAGGLSVGLGDDYPGHYWHYALFRISHAAKSEGLQAIDGPYTDFDDIEGYRQSCRWASLCGCDGKWAIHPNQIDVANDVFAPTQEEAERARKIVEEYEKAMDEGKGAVTVDGEMVDEAVNKIAKDIVDKAEAAGIL